MWLNLAVGRMETDNVTITAVTLFLAVVCVVEHLASDSTAHTIHKCPVVPSLVYLGFWCVTTTWIIVCLCYQSYGR